MCGGGHRKSFVSVLENFQAKNLLAICLGVYTVGCVNSLKVKFFRHIAMNRHIKSVHFTTKIRKTRKYGHAFLTLVIIPQCHSFVILVIKPPFFLPNSSPVEHISMHTYSIGWHLSCYHPPMHAYSVGWHLSCYHHPSQPRLLPYFPLVHVACKFICLFLQLHICVES